MKTLKWMTIVALFIGTSVSASAQQKQRQHRHMSDSAQMEQRLDKIATELELTEKQQKEFDALVAEHKITAKATHEKYQSQRELHRAEMQKVRTTFETDLKKILTTEQAAKFDELKAQRQQNRQNKKENCCKNKGKGNGQGQGYGQEKE